MTVTQSTPARIGEFFIRAFGLRPGIKRIQLNVEISEVTLTVTYMAPDQATMRVLENLVQEFKLVSKEPV